MNNRQEKPPLKCLLGIDPEKTQKCKPSECASCGWEAAEAARRREYVKEHGLTLCADGFRRLIIRKEKDMATPYKEWRYVYSAFRRRYQRRHTGKPLTNDQNATKQCTLSATLTRDIIITLNYCELNSAG